MKIGASQVGQYSTQVQEQLQRILSSPPFRQSLRQQRLLKFLVGAFLEGNAHRVKGYTLGVEVFDRSEDFDPDANALVRVEVGRLRSKLLEYYSTSTSSDILLFELPKGNYQLSVSLREPLAAAATIPTGLMAINEPSLEQIRQKPSIAVLPFEDLSEHQDSKWFAEGMAEDLITDLSKISGLRVCSRYASRMHEQAGLQLSAVAQALQVRYILQGTVRRAPGSVRVNATLTDALNAQVVWTERYDRSDENALTVQSELSAKIVNGLTVALTPLEQVRLGYLETSSSKAYEEFVRGLQELWKYSQPSNLLAQQHFRRAIELEPDYASSHAWLVRCLVYDYTMGWNKADVDTLENAARLIDHALQIDGLLPLAHAMKSWVSLWQFKLDKAVEAGRLAVALDPNNVDGRAFLSVALAIARRSPEAIRHSEVALELNPAPTAFHLWAHGMALMYQGRFVESAQVFARGIQVGPGFVPNHIFRMHSLVQADRLEQAREAAQAYQRVTGSDRVMLRSPLTRGTPQISWRESLEKAGLTLLE